MSTGIFQLDAASVLGTIAANTITLTDNSANTVKLQYTGQTATRHSELYLDTNGFLKLDVTSDYAQGAAFMPQDPVYIGSTNILTSSGTGVVRNNNAAFGGLPVHSVQRTDVLGTLPGSFNHISRLSGRTTNEITKFSSLYRLFPSSAYRAKLTASVSAVDTSITVDNSAGFGVPTTTGQLFFSDENVEYYKVSSATVILITESDFTTPKQIGSTYNIDDYVYLYQTNWWNTSWLEGFAVDNSYWSPKAIQSGIDPSMSTTKVWEEIHVIDNFKVFGSGSFPTLTLGLGNAGIGVPGTTLAAEATSGNSYIDVVDGTSFASLQPGYLVITTTTTGQFYSSTLRRYYYYKADTGTTPHRIYLTTPLDQTYTVGDGTVSSVYLAAPTVSTYLKSANPINGNTSAGNYRKTVSGVHLSSATTVTFTNSTNLSTYGRLMFKNNKYVDYYWTSGNTVNLPSGMTLNDFGITSLADQDPAWTSDNNVPLTITGFGSASSPVLRLSRSTSSTEGYVNLNVGHGASLIVDAEGGVLPVKTAGHSSRNNLGSKAKRWGSFWAGQSNLSDSSGSYQLRLEHTADTNWASLRATSAGNLEIDLSASSSSANIYPDSNDAIELGNATQRWKRLSTNALNIYNSSTSANVPISVNGNSTLDITQTTAASQPLLQLRNSQATAGDVLRLYDSTGGVYTNIRSTSSGLLFANTGGNLTLSPLTTATGSLGLDANRWANSYIVSSRITNLIGLTSGTGVIGGSSDRFNIFGGTVDNTSTTTGTLSVGTTVNTSLVPSSASNNLGSSGTHWGTVYFNNFGNDINPLTAGLNVGATTRLGEIKAEKFTIQASTGEIGYIRGSGGGVEIKSSVSGNPMIYGIPLILTLSLPRQVIVHARSESLIEKYSALVQIPGDWAHATDQFVYSDAAWTTSNNESDTVFETGIFYFGGIHSVALDTLGSLGGGVYGDNVSVSYNSLMKMPYDGQVITASVVAGSWGWNSGTSKVMVKKINTASNQYSLDYNNTTIYSGGSTAGKTYFFDTPASFDQNDILQFQIIPTGVTASEVLRSGITLSLVIIYNI